MHYTFKLEFGVCTTRKCWLGGHFSEHICKVAGSGCMHPTGAQLQAEQPQMFHVVVRYSGALNANVYITLKFKPFSHVYM